MAYLPDLPPSDEKSLKQNKLDPFYQVRPADLWKDARIETVELKEASCTHRFIERENDYLCKKCKMGLSKEGLSLKKDGHLYHHNEKII